MRNYSYIALLLIVGCSSATATKPATSMSATELAERAVHRRAVDAVIWGMPVVNFDRMVQATIANGVKLNEIVYWSQPVSWKDQTLTPNPDTIYFNPFYDTRKGPVVLEIPPATDDGMIVGSVDNAWQNALEDVGIAGVDKGKGGKYLITPPGYKDQPPEGYIVLPSDTYQGFAILRSNFKSRTPADIAKAVAYGKRIKLHPLSLSAESTVYVDVYDNAFEATIPYDLRFFESLHRMVQIEPWLTRDKVMIDYLKTIGIEKGKEFKPDAKTKAILESAAKEAHAAIAASYKASFAKPFFRESNWGVPVPQATIEGMSSSFTDPNSYGIDGRAVYFSIAYFSAKHLGAGQFYLMAINDNAGRPLDGKKGYRLTVPANAPVKQYWSVTAYNRETHALIKNTSRSSRSSNAADVQTNADGSTDIYFGPTAPAGKESNWVPTKAGEGFEVLFRLYGPEKRFFDKLWTLPDIEKSQ